VIVLATLSAGCFKPSLIQQGRMCDYVSDLALESCPPLHFSDESPVGHTMMLWGVQYRECRMKHEMLKSCIEYDRKENTKR
jgi:hypothetical protein